jgi:ABC-type enterochelin transport system permease subunit
LALPKHRLLGYQRIAKSCGLIANLPVFAVPNIVKSLFACLLFPAMMLSAKTDAHLICLISRIMGRFLPQRAD